MLPSQGGDASSILVSRSEGLSRLTRSATQRFMYHGIILDAEFKDPLFPEGFKVFAKKKSSTSSWILYGIEVNDKDVNEVISDIQDNIKSNEPYYAHLYNDEEVIVIFKKRVFHVKSHNSTWMPIIEFGRTLNIPDEQLDFWPNRFQDEVHYFKS
jgi:hypothetical protein